MFDSRLSTGFLIENAPMARTPLAHALTNYHVLQFGC